MLGHHALRCLDLTLREWRAACEDGTTVSGFVGLCESRVWRSHEVVEVLSKMRMRCSAGCQGGAKVRVTNLLGGALREAGGVGHGKDAKHTRN
jgi:hypothetical protein